MDFASGFSFTHIQFQTKLTKEWNTNNNSDYLYTNFLSISLLLYQLSNNYNLLSNSS